MPNPSPRTDHQDPATGRFTQVYDWDRLRPLIIDCIAGGATTAAACRRYGVPDSCAFLYHIGRGGEDHPHMKQYRQAQRVALEQQYDDLRDLDRRALLPPSDPEHIPAKQHGAVARNMQWRLERLNSLAFGKESHHVHDIKVGVAGLMDKLHNQQDRDRNTIEGKARTIEDKPSE